MKESVSLAQFKAHYILDFAEPEIVRRGKAYYTGWSRCRLQNFSSEKALYTVRGTHDYRVAIYVEEDEFFADCNCPYSDDVTEIICKHKIAAALHLENHLRYNKVPDWRGAIETILNHKAKKAAPTEFLIFSLQNENSRWTVIPFQLPARFFPPQVWKDDERIRQIISDENLTPFAKKLKTNDYWNDKNYVNLETKQKSLLKFFTGDYSFSYYGFNFEAFVALVGDLPIFRGSTVNPFKNPLKIYYETGRVGFDVQRTEQELTLRPQIFLDGTQEETPIRLNNVEVLNQNPLWLLGGDKIFTVSETVYLFERLRANAVLQIPLAEESFFWEKFLPTLAETYKISGEAINWRDLDYERIDPRLYLSEKDETLQIELRFAYAHLEIPAEKNPAPEAVRRDAETGSLYRFRRDPVYENEVREMISAARFGLKKTSEASVFLLRAKNHPFDFLTKYVPLLTAEGFEIFGEESLKAVKINRNRPTISFGITSGIDWFDLNAVVRFGEIAVSLKDFRRAVKKRERFVKLADGSIGEIPAEWLEKYKHLFGLGNDEAGEKLRFGKYHLTLLDQLFDSEQTVEADREFKSKLEKLKSFENIKERKPPKNFSGKLRPYQKHGFDWLYFSARIRFRRLSGGRYGNRKNDSGSGIFAVSERTRRTAIRREFADRAAFSGFQLAA